MNIYFVTSEAYRNQSHCIEVVRVPPEPPNLMHAHASTKGRVNDRMKMCIRNHCSDGCHLKSDDLI